MRFFSGERNYCDEEWKQCTYNNGQCGVRTPDRMYFCTRPKGHVGAHIACCLWEEGEVFSHEDHNMKVWRDNDVSDNYSRCTEPLKVPKR